MITHPTNHSPNVWSVPKGLIEKDENSLDAAIRELEEETALNLKDVRIDNLYGEIPIKYATGKKILRSYVAYTKELLYDYPYKCDSMVVYMNRKRLEHPFPECDDWKWVSIEEAEELLHEAQVRILDIILSNNVNQWMI